MKRITFHYKCYHASESVKILLAWAASVGLFFYAFIVIFLYSAFLLFLIFASSALAIVQSLVDLTPHYTIVIGVFTAAAVLFVLAGVYPYYRFATEFRSKIKDVIDLHELSELPERMQTLVSHRINGLTENMPARHARRLHSRKIRYLYEKKNFTAVPSMVFESGVINLVIPLGFFKLLQAFPESADAILAHELAHFFHNDSNMLLKVRCYYQLVGLWDIYSPLLVLSSFLWGMAGAAKAVGQNPEKSEKISLLPAVAITICFVIVDQFLRKFAHDLLLGFVRERILRAEEMADLYSMTVTSPQALKDYLTLCVSNSDASYSLHPTLRRRLAQVERFSSPGTSRNPNSTERL